MRPPGPTKEKAPPPSPQQLEMLKMAVEASARITAAMVTVTVEKNPAKITEAYKTIFKAVQESMKPGA